MVNLFKIGLGITIALSIIEKFEEASSRFAIFLKDIDMEMEKMTNIHYQCTECGEIYPKMRDQCSVCKTNFSIEKLSKNSNSEKDFLTFSSLEFSNYDSEE